MCESGYDEDEARSELVEFMMDDYLNLIRTPSQKLSADAISVIAQYERYIEFLGDHPES